MLDRYGLSGCNDALKMCTLYVLLIAICEIYDVKVKLALSQNAVFFGVFDLISQKNHSNRHSAL